MSKKRNSDSIPTLYKIGGGPLGLRTLEIARELGMGLIVTDRNPNAPGMALADETYLIDGGDVDGHLEIASQTQANVVAVLCGAEFGSAAVNALRAHFGLPCNSPESLRCVLDKEEMKRAFVLAGVPTPQGEIAETAEQIIEIMRAKERVIVKPLGGSGSRGVRVLDRGDDVRETLDIALASVPDERAVIVETYVEGASIDVNGFLVDGKLYPAGVLEKFSTPLPTRLPMGGYDPANLSPLDTCEVYELLAQSARAVGLTSGPVKGDLLLAEDGLQVLEIGARFHGDVTTAGTLPFGSGLDPVRAYLSWCVRGEVEQEQLVSGESGYATWRVLALPPGRLVQQPDLSTCLEKHPNIGLAWHRLEIGDTIQPYADTTKIPGYITAHGKTKEEAEAALVQWFEGEIYVVDADPAHATWYSELVTELREIGFDPRCSGVSVEAS
ncbi:MAG: biotin carboxylase [Planctomycetota bacterium]|jgi:biotin carboxylase